MSSSISKKNKGRQKVEMKKMTNENNLLVTFSKRRAGLFKKASELCTLTGAEVALIIFSPRDNASSFGHPDVDTVVKRYLTGAPPPQITSTMQTLETLSINSRVRKLNGELNELMNQLEAEKKRAEELKKQRKEIEAKFPWAAQNKDLSRPELEKKKAYLEELKKNLTRQIDQGLLIQSASNLSQFYAGSSSSDPLPSPVQAAPPQVFLPSETLPAFRCQ